RTVRFCDFRDDADRIRELIRRRQHRMNGAPGKLAMADLTAARAAEAAGLADREGREVIVKHEGLFVGAFKRVDILLVLARAQRGDDQRLRLATREQRRAMRARQYGSFADDRPHRYEIAPVDAMAGIENGVANDVLLEMLEGLRNL